MGDGLLLFMNKKVALATAIMLNGYEISVYIQKGQREHGPSANDSVFVSIFELDA